MLYGEKKAVVRRGASLPVCEPVEARRLLATVVGGTTQVFNLTPDIENAGDGTGNKIARINPDVQDFRLAAFGRLDLNYAVQGFVDEGGNPTGQSFAMTYALWRDEDGNGALSAADVKIATLGSAATQMELSAADYLFIVTPTSGDTATRANVRLTLKHTVVSGGKISVSGSGLPIADGDSTPNVFDFTNFGTVPVGVINNDRTFIVRNTGGGSLSLGAIGVPAGFVVKSGLPATLAGGASASFTISMATNIAGTRGGVLSFSTNDASVGGTFSFSISGTADANALPAKSGLQRLRINGTNGADSIVLTQNATRVIFNVNGNLYSVLKTKIRRGISVDAFTGNDLVSVDSSITLPVLIVGGGGNDTLIGGGGNDTLMGFDGDDALRGGLGADLLDGGNGTDLADYSERTNGVVVTLDGLDNDGEPGELDRVLTNVENVMGGAGNDTITGSDGPNVLYGLAGKDFLLGLGGNDSLVGGAGNDTLRPGLGKDTLVGGAHSDMADYSERNVPLFLSNDDVADDGAAGENDLIGSDVERIIGGSADDLFDLFTNGSTAFGMGGADTIRGTDGNDALFGGDGDDQIFGFGGNDYIEGNAGNDTINGNRGNDTIMGGTGDDRLDGESDNDSLNGEEGNDTVFTGRGADIARGGPGNDRVEKGFNNVGSGANGVDSLFGDGGNDTLSVTLDDFEDGFADVLDGGTGTDIVGQHEVGVDILVNIP